MPDAKEVSGEQRSKQIAALQQYREKSFNERMDEKAVQKTDYDTPQDNWEFVTIPEENALGEKHDNMSINHRVFEAGKTYKLPPKIAETLKERLRVYMQSTRRILQPRLDANAMKVVAEKGTPGGSFIDPNHQH